MRGPLGSLICASSTRNYSKKRFPHRFLPSAGAPHTMHAACQSARPWQETVSATQLTLGKAFSARGESAARQPIWEAGSSCYLIG